MYKLINELERKNNTVNKNVKINKRKGISLIALVIIIIIMLIITSVVMLTVLDTSPIEDANEAVIRSDIRTMQEEYELAYLDAYAKNLGEESKITNSDLLGVIPDKYKDDFKATTDGIIYIGNDETVEKIAVDMGIITGKYEVIKDVLVIPNVTSINVEVVIVSGESIDEYVYQIRQKGTSEWNEYNSVNNTLTIENLLENVEYEVKVLAIQGEKTYESEIISVITQEEIKLGTLTLKLNSASGENYVENTWSNAKVYVSVSGENTTYSVSGANSVSETTSATVLTNDGISTITLKTTKDTASKTQDYTVKIDKGIPEIKELSSNVTGLTNSEITITGKAKDSVSGIVAYVFSKDASIIASSNGWNQIESTTAEITKEYKVSENNKYYFYVMDSAKNVTKQEIQIDKIDNTLPTNTAPTLTSTTNSVTATFKQTDENGIDNTTRAYAIKKTLDSTWGEFVTSDSDSYTFERLDKNTSYDVKTYVVDNAGNENTSQVASISTIDITKPEISAPEDWVSTSVEVTITYPEIVGTTREYSTDGKNWDTVDTLEKKIQVSTNNTVVYARVIDSTNQTSGNVEYEVKCIDSSKPQINSFSKETAPTNTAVTLTGKAQDAESGIVAYMFSTDANLTAESTGWTEIVRTTEEIELTYSANENTKYYFYVKNDADLIEKAEVIVDSIDKVAPTFDSIEVTSPATGTYKAGQEIEIVARYSENITGTVPVLKIKFGTGTERTISSGTIENNSIKYTYKVQNGDNGVLACTSYYGTLTDVAGNNLTVSRMNFSGNSITADTTEPTLNSISITSPATGTYKAGQEVEIVVTYSENITGTVPVLKIKFTNTEERVINTGIINANTIIYKYIITAQDNGILTSTSYIGEVTDSVGNSLSVKNEPITGNAITASTEYTIKYNLNGGENPSVVTEKYNYTSANITLPTPTKLGYTFDGWYEIEDFTSNKVTVITKGTTGNKEYYAKWLANEYTYDIVYKTKSDNELGVDTIKGNYGETKEVSPKEFTGYTTPSVQSVIWDSINAKEIMFTYDPIVYSVTIDCNGGSGVESSSYTFETANYTLGIPERKGYTFAGWTGSNGETAQISVTIAKGSTGNLNYKANWKAIDYTITYNANSGTGVSNSTYTVEDKITLQIPTKVGYTFAGWYDNEELAGTEVKIIETGSTENKEFWAKWTPNTDTAYKVQHWMQNLDGDADSYDDLNYSLDKTVTLQGTTDTKVTPSVQMYEGFTSPETQEVTILPDGSLVVNYFYKRNSYTVTLNAGAGIKSVSGAGDYLYGEEVTISAVVIEGYQWGGWIGTYNTVEQEYRFIVTENAIIKACTMEITENEDGEISGYVPPVEEPQVPEEIPEDKLPKLVEFQMGEFESTVNYVPGEYETVEYEETYTVTNPPVGWSDVVWSTWQITKDENGNVISTEPREISLSDIGEKYTDYILYDFETDEANVLNGVEGDSVKIWFSYKSVEDTLDNIIYLAAYLNKKDGCTTRHVAKWENDQYVAVDYDKEIAAVTTFTKTYTVTKTVQVEIKKPEFSTEYVYIPFGTMKAESGMTWNQWLESNYNTIGKTNIVIKTSEFEDVDYTDEIIEGKNYGFFEKKMEAGLYDLNDNLVADWDTLVNTYGLDVENKDNAYEIFSSSELSSGTRLIISDSVNSIGNEEKLTFIECGLLEIDIPNSVTYIGPRAFCYCDASINVDKDNLFYKSQDGILFNKAMTELIRYPSGKNESSYEIPNSVTTIGDYAFDYCLNLTSIIIPNSVTTIGNAAFAECEELEFVTIPNSVTTISNDAFGGCYSLTTIIIPDSVTYIGSNAFDGCIGLTSVYFEHVVPPMIDIACFCRSGCGCGESTGRDNGCTLYFKNRDVYDALTEECYYNLYCTKSTYFNWTLPSESSTTSFSLRENVEYTQPEVANITITVNKDNSDIVTGVYMVANEAEGIQSLSIIDANQNVVKEIFLSGETSYSGLVDVIDTGTYTVNLVTSTGVTKQMTFEI